MCGSAVEMRGESALILWRIVEVVWRHVDDCGVGFENRD
jgi:hypothetical protein